MKKQMTKCMLVAMILTIGALSSCVDDDNTYDVVYPDNEEFCMIHTNSAAQIIGMTNDDDEYFTFTSPLTDSRAEADTVYRAYVAYMYTDDPAYVTCWQGVFVSVCPPQSEDNFPNGIRTDEVLGVEVLEIGNNHNYINMIFALYPQTGDDYNVWGCVKSTDEITGKTTLTIYHEQNAITSYTEYGYTYLCVPIKGYFKTGEVVDVVVHTTNGTYTKTFAMPNLDD